MGSCTVCFRVLGGFAHVYLCRTKELIRGKDQHVLKRVAVREKSLLDEVRREVEVMVRSSLPRRLVV
jgi:hypothetical protein